MPKKLWKLKSAQVTVVTGAAGTNGQNVIVHVTKVLEPDHVNVTVHPAHQSTSVHALANQMNLNHVTFHHAKTVSNACLKLFLHIKVLHEERKFS